MSAGQLRVLQLQSLHANNGGDVDVMNHERQLLQAAGHIVDRYEVPSVEDSDLAPAKQVGKVVWNRQSAADVRQRIAAFGPDVLHVHSPYPLMSPSVVRAGSKAGLPTVITLHNYVFNCVAGTLSRDGALCHSCIGKKAKLDGIRYRCYHDSFLGSSVLTASVLLHRRVGSLTHDVDRYIALTAFARDLMVSDGYAEDQVVVKPNSVPDTAGFHAEPDTKAPYVVFAGRLVEVKGVRTLLEAWSRLGNHDLRLVIAGDGDLRSEVEEAARSDPSIDYVGFVSQERVTELMAGAAATIVPSQWYEAGAPLVQVGSLSVGTPVLVSSLATMEPTVTADASGRGFTMGDVASLETHLRGIAADRAPWVAMRAAARASFEARYSPQENVRALVSIYRDVIGERLAAASNR